MDLDYNFKALTEEGKVIKGTRRSSDEFSLKQALKKEGLTLVHAEAIRKGSMTNRFKGIKITSGVNMQSKIILYRNLSAMLGAGLALTRALSILERQTKNKILRNTIIDINDRIKKGSTLSLALTEHKDIFSSLMISMVQSGEESGNLVDSLKVVADQLEKQYILNKKIKGAMVYPGVILSAMLVIGIFMMVYIVPTLTKTFSELNVDLPASTQFIIDLSDYVQTNLFTALILLFAFIFGLIFAGKSRIGKKFFDWAFLHAPVVKEIVIAINSARTTRTLASLLAAGVPFVRAIQITTEVVQNTYYKEVLVQAEKQIQIGGQISVVFKKYETLYPAFVSEMMAVGEETGELGKMLLNVATFYEDEVEQKTKNMSTIIEPVMMIVVGIIVGFFAISMISPMYSLVDTI